MNTAIIVAAGSGSRFGASVPKQFLKVHNKPLFIHTLEKFESCRDVQSIVLVLPQEYLTEFADASSRYRITKLHRIVSGGVTRAHSVKNGLNAIDPVEAGIVAVHDGARPFISAAEISKCIRCAEDTGAAILVGPVTDTIKQVDGEQITKTIDRATLRRALTPQCFRYQILRDAFEAADDDVLTAATDESYLVEALGLSVSVIDGSASNIKVTTKQDLKMFERFLEEIDD
jgi:2-C-methyl-D-erythritol 4-phosphate cytidylyltransferase